MVAALAIIGLAIAAWAFVNETIFGTLVATGVLSVAVFIAFRG